MKIHYLLISLVVVFSLFGSELHASRRSIGGDQKDYEREINSVVRRKLFYKSGRFELTPRAGVMPYDSVVNHVMFGGSAVWHLSDHFGWEIADFQIVQPSITSFTTDLVSSKGISNLQATKLNLLASTNLVISPVYGKVRLFGSTIVHFDIYFTLGLGVARTKIATVTAAGAGQAATSTDSTSTMDPMLNMGFGFKFFVNSALGIVLDVRDYVTYSTLYGGKRLKSNFGVFGGLSFYLPTFD